MASEKNDAGDHPVYRSRRLDVPKPFEEVFSHFYIAANTGSVSVTRTLVPSFQTLLVFSFGVPVSFATQQNNSLSIEQCLLLGTVKQPLRYTLPAGSEIVVVNFKGDGFFRFFGRVINEYLVVHPDALVEDNCFEGLWRHMKEGKSDHERIDILLHFCRPYLKKRDETLEMIVALEEETSQLNTIKAVAKQTGQSERSVQSKHKKYLGYTAKEMNRYQRFLKAIELVGQLATGNKKLDRFDIIEGCGYYDQAQLIHEFQLFLQLTPTQYLSFQQDICTSR